MRGFVFASAVLFGSLPALAQSPHVHGLAGIRMAMEDGVVEAEIVLPASDVVGFERAPRDDAEEQAIDAALTMLEDGVAVIGLPAAAECQQTERAVISTPAGEDETGDHHHGKDAARHDGEHGHHDKDAHDHGDRHGSEHEAKEEGHAEFALLYRFECRSPNALDGITPGVMTLFPSLESVDVQALTASGQAAGRVTRDSPTLSF